MGVHEFLWTWAVLWNEGLFVSWGWEGCFLYYRQEELIYGKGGL